MNLTTKRKKNREKNILNMYEFDHAWWEDSKAQWGLSNNNSLYLKKKARKLSYEVFKKNKKSEEFESLKTFSTLKDAKIFLAKKAKVKKVIMKRGLPNEASKN